MPVQGVPWSVDEFVEPSLPGANVPELRVRYRSDLRAELRTGRTGTPSSESGVWQAQLKAFTASSLTCELVTSVAHSFRLAFARRPTGNSVGQSVARSSEELAGLWLK